LAQLNQLAAAFDGASLAELCGALVVADVFDRGDVSTRQEMVRAAAVAMGPEKISTGWQFLACVAWPGDCAFAAADGRSGVADRSES